MDAETLIRTVQLNRYDAIEIRRTLQHWVLVDEIIDNLNDPDGQEVWVVHLTRTGTTAAAVSSLCRGENADAGGEVRRETLGAVARRDQCRVNNLMELTYAPSQPQVIAQRIQSALDHNHYHLLYRNCEGWINRVKFGFWRSLQASVSRVGTIHGRCGSIVRDLFVGHFVVLAGIRLLLH